jgi:hypothetical protein
VCSHSYIAFEERILAGCDTDGEGLRNEGH